jgi:AraC-like DNA-binding protein
MTSTLIVGLSGGFIALALLMSLLAWRDARDVMAGRLLAVLSASLAALEMTTGPMGGALPDWLWAPVRLIAGFNVALLWLFCLSILRDGFRLRGAEGAGLVLFSIGPLATTLDLGAVPDSGVLLTLIGLAPVLAIGHIIWVAISERKRDLVEGRYVARVWLVLILLVAALVSLGSEYLADDRQVHLVRLLVASLPVAVILYIWLTALNSGRLDFEGSKSGTGPAGSGVDPRDRALLAALTERMDAGLYREPGLTLERLAEVLGTPAHRLRAVINQGLGYRNFPAFVNSYRLDHARGALADPARGRETVLAIAYESGFSALQTFNRVFKEAEQEAPTRYRERQLREAAQNQKLPLDS